MVIFLKHTQNNWKIYESMEVYIISTIRDKFETVASIRIL